MTAVLPAPNREQPTPRVVDDPAGTLLRLLAHRNIASKASTIHRYDHEILGSTVVRPLVGRLGDAHADGVVLAEPTATDGIAIGIGVNPWYGVHDPERMAYAAVDEAIRNVVAVGADPDRVALLDNFSWGDPRRPSTLGELVAAVDGCVAAATAYRAPFVSGKDSLNNEYTGADGKRHAVPPTLVITAVAHVPDADRCVTPVLQRAGRRRPAARRRPDRSSPGRTSTSCSVPPAKPASSPRPIRMRPSAIAGCIGRSRDGLVRACHDVSEGGLAVALAEMCIAGRLGITVTALPDRDLATALFAESTGRLRRRGRAARSDCASARCSASRSLVHRRRHRRRRPRRAGHAGDRRDRAGRRLQPHHLPRGNDVSRPVRTRRRRSRHEPRPRPGARAATGGRRADDRARQ